MSRRKRHVVRRLADGRYVCKGCPFSSTDSQDGLHHAMSSVRDGYVVIQRMESFTPIPTGEGS
jgi:hypothetical protein